MGPAEWFTGQVHIDAVASPGDTDGVGVAMVRFAPGARTAWHTHPRGQTIHVVDGVGACQSRGGPVEIIRPGETVVFAPGEDHWHGAHPTRFMSHLAVHGADGDGVTVTWGDRVTDEEYGATPALG